MKANKNHPLYLEDLQYVISTKGSDRLKGKTVLITGATGLIGLQLVDSLMHAGDIRIIATGRSREKAANRLGEHFGNPLFQFLEQDVHQPFPDGIKADYIIPLASNTHPLAYSKFPVETVLTNVLGAKNALELAAKCGATVLYPSSVEIYGNADGSVDFTEDYTGSLDLSTPRSCYTESKRVCEALCQSYAAEYGVSVKIARLSRVFGPTILESDTKASSQFILKAVAAEDIVLKSEGNQYFSYTYVADAAAALLHIMLNGENGQAYNVASEGCNVHLKDFAAACARICGKKVIFDIPGSTEAKGYSIASRAILSCDKLTAIGFRAKYNIEDALERTVEIMNNK
ncbi:MAG: NAD-dependent epimerase/dehydratase family protein [Bacteroidales bacterium]|nr:NAD-dependent epimerase/dehydratase family protein [Bacteroidales bacterium]